MKRPILWIFLAYACMILFMGQYNVVPFLSPAPTEIQTLTGIVRDTSITRTGRQSILFESDDGLRIQSLLRHGEKVLLGQRITLRGQLLDLRSPDNRGEFNEWLFFRRQNIHYRMFPDVVDRGDVERRSFVYVNDLRERITSIYDAVLPPTQSGIVRSMLIGDRSGLSDEIRALYADTGIAHILAISGMHVSALIGGIYLLLKYLGISKRDGSIFVIGFLIFYTILTGASVSTVRAAVMHSVYLIGNIFYRDKDSLTALSFAGLLLLIYQPLFLFDLGFQYSFTAVFALMLLTNPTEKAIVYAISGDKFLSQCFRNSYMRKYLSGCIVASVATLPITMFYFQYIPVYTVLANLIIVSSVSLIIILGFIIPIVGFFNLTLATFIAAPVYYLLHVYELILGLIVRLPFAVVTVENISLVFIFFYYVALGLFGYVFSSRRNMEKFKNVLQKIVKG